MAEILSTFYPVIILIAIGLTITASYTALDMLSLSITSERNRTLLFNSSVIVMGIGIWIMNFMGLIALDGSRFAVYQVQMATFSIFIAVIFSGAAFYILRRKSVHLLEICFSSFLLTIAAFAVHFLIFYSVHVTIKYYPLLLLFSGLFIFTSSFFSLWLQFKPIGSVLYEQTWQKPVSAVILAGAIVGGHYSLNESVLLSLQGQVIHENGLTGSIYYIYLVFFVSGLILSGLVFSSLMNSKRLAISDTNLRDIKTALDESSIVTISDSDGKIMYVNDKFEKISKYKKEEILGKDHRFLNSGYHSKEFFQNMWATIQSGQIWKGEIRNKAKDGNYYWLDTTIVPFFEKSKKPKQYIAIRTDITQRKKAEEDLLNSVKETSDITFALDQSSIVAITDSKGVITRVNDKFCEISKYSREELLGQDHKILNSGYHPKEFFQTMWKTIRDGRVWKGEIRNKAKDGTLYWVDTTIVPFVDEQGKSYQYLAIRNDITERKRTEAILHRQDKLAAVGQLAAGVAHEIRNPLTSMKGYAEFLQLDEQDPERLEFLNIILDEIDRVNSIVEDFMVLAKPKAVELEEKNVVPVIKDVVSLLSFEARKRNVHLNFDCNQEIIQIECDENRLKQVFLNFIKNGIEAMPNGGDLYVKVNIHDRNVNISIQDTGVGIPEEKLGKLGEPFFTTKRDGNGLGLMVSFKIIESHNGKVFVESEPNKGTTFKILLPAKTA